MVAKPTPIVIVDHSHLSKASRASLIAPHFTTYAPRLLCRGKQKTSFNPGPGSGGRLWLCWALFSLQSDLWLSRNQQGPAPGKSFHLFGIRSGPFV